MPPSRTVELAARLVMIAATLWLGLAAVWEIAGPVVAGHYAVVGSRSVIADNIVTWGIWGGVRAYTFDKPTPDLYYGNHPWGTFWMVGAAFKLLGRDETVIRLVPVLWTVVIPPMLFSIGRVLWGAVPGALAALAYVACPAVLAFANFPGFEGAVILGVITTLYGYVHFTRTWQRRFMLVSLVGVLVAAHSDWIAYLFLGGSLAALLVVHVFLPRRWFGPIDVRRFTEWWTLAAGLCVLSVVLYVALLHKYDLLVELFRQGERRASGSDLPLDQVLERRRYWIESMFTPVAIVVGKLAAVVLVFRLVLLRKPAELMLLALLGMGLFHYLYFKQAADVHIYWPLPFAPFFALGLGLLGASLLDVTRWLLARRGKTSGPRSQLVVLGVFSLAPLAMLPDAVTVLDYARATGGRLNDDGHLNLQDADKTAALGFMVERMQPPARTVLIARSMKFNWSQLWVLRRPTREIDRLPSSPSQGDGRYLLLDSRFSSAAELEDVAKTFYVQVIGPFWMVDRGVAWAPIDAHRFVEREPKLLEWYFRQAHDPMREVAADPFLTWELRLHYGQEPNPAPQVAPEDREQRRIAHNIALLRGDTAIRDRLRQELLADMDRKAHARYDDGTELVGTLFQPGVAPVLEVLFSAGGPTPGEAQFEVRSRVLEKKRFSWIGADDKTKNVGTRFSLPPHLWKAGFLYAYRTEIRKRPGRERFSGSWVSRGEPAPIPVPRAGPVVLLELR